MNKRNLFFVLFCFSSFLFFSCISTPENPKNPKIYEENAFIPESFTWEKFSEGFEFCSVFIPETPVIYHIAKIDFSVSNTEIFSYNANTNKNRGLSPSDFSEALSQKSPHSVSINTSPFDASVLYHIFPKSPFIKYSSLGIHIEKNKIISEPVERYAALCFQTDGEKIVSASIHRGQTPSVSSAFSNCDYAFGGYFVILENFIPENFPARNLDSRTACGLSPDGKTIFILSVEGEFKTKSTGLSYQDCALIFQKLGCSDAMQFDGGGSSSLYINGKNQLTHKKSRNAPAFLGLCIQ